MPRRNKKAKNAARQKTRETPIEFLTSSAGIIVTCLFIIIFVGQTFAIPSGSMQNTLLIGDHVLVDRVQFAPRNSWLSAILPHREIQHGDIVVFLSPQTPGLPIVKRIIGVPGDRIHLRGGVVYRNGQRLSEPYVLHDRDNPPDNYRDNFPAVPPADFDRNVWNHWRAELPAHIEGEDIVVPPNCYFGMGDHRGVSLDSRYWGFIPVQNVIGRPLLVYWSFDATELDYQEKSFEGRVLSIVHEVIHFFDETRWQRTLMQLR